jgi:hypothetical protein
MSARPLAIGLSRAYRATRTRRLAEKFALALAGAALLSAFLFVLVHVGEAVSILRADNAVSDIFYPNCAAARAAGVAPIYAHQPGYCPGLDADKDGIACEPFRNWGANN